MTQSEIISLAITIIGLTCFCLAFTFLFRHYYNAEIEKIETGKRDVDILDDILLQNRLKQKKGRKALKIVGKVLSYIFLAVVAVVFVTALVNKMQGGMTFINSTSLVVIASGSMSEKNEENDYLVENNLNNQFNTYDVIGIQKYNSVNDINLYDVVAYKSDNITIIHRVIRITTAEDGTRQFYTRGDSNNADDTGTYYKSYLSYDQILGYYNGTRIQGIGIVIFFLQSYAGIITVVALIYCFFMYDHFSNKYEKSIATRSETLLELVNFDFEDEEAVNKAGASYQETLIYKGNAYFFQDNEFIKKEEAVNYVDPVYIKDDRGKHEVYVKDHNTNTIKPVTSAADLIIDNKPNE